MLILSLLNANVSRTNTIIKKPKKKTEEEEKNDYKTIAINNAANKCERPNREEIREMRLFNEQQKNNESNYSKLK